MIVLRSLYRTCFACPAQWQGTTDDGRKVYVRYRHGWLTIGVGATHDEAVDASAGFDGKTPLLAVEDDPNEDDGYMDEDELFKRAGHVIGWAA